MPTASHTITFAAEPGETPVTVTATVISMECKQERDFLGVRHGLSAQLEVTVAPAVGPRTYFLSRLVGESDWVVDALFASNGFPHFSHGFGARYLRLRGVAPELEDLLDQHARDHGLVQAIGRGVPVVLTDATPDHQNLS
jgi:hypothetical protein